MKFLSFPSLMNFGDSFFEIAPAKCRFLFGMMGDYSFPFRRYQNLFFPE